MERNINAEATTRASVAGARRVLSDHPSSLVTRGFRSHADGPREFVTNLATSVGSGAAVEQRVTVAIGVPVPDDAGFLVTIAWQPTGHRRLIPSFTGVLSIVALGVQSRLTLRGAYRVPLGPAGRFGDRVIGHRLATRSVQELLDGIARRLEVEAAHQGAPMLPPPAGPDSGSVIRSENYIG